MPGKQSLCQFVPFYAKEAEFMPVCPILSQRCRVLKRCSQFTSKIFTIYTKGNPSLHQRSRVLVSDSLCPHKNISSVNCWTTLLQTNLGSCHGMVHHYTLVHWEESVQRNKRQRLCIKWSRPSWWVVQNLELREKSGDILASVEQPDTPVLCVCPCMCDLWVAQPYHGPMDSFAASGMLVKNSSLMNKYQYCTGLVSCTSIQHAVSELKPACS